MVKLSNLPSPPTVYSIDFPKLDGGLNLLELDYRLDANESPEMRNLWWRDGVLCCRDGQTYLTSPAALGVGYSCYEALFHDCGFFHVGDGLYWGDLSDPDAGSGSLELELLVDGVPERPGCWFRYGECLYYKCPGAYIEISWDEESNAFTAQDVPVYSPIIQINSEPAEGSGDTYQPENRLCPQKTVWYTAAEDVTEYHLPVDSIDSVDKVVVDDVELSQGAGFSVDLAAGIVTFTTAPAFHNPTVPNTVQITYSKANPDAYSSVMDCRYATTFGGGDRNVCVVLAGCSAQPNAYFWCGNHAVMDPGYFPMEQYNLAGSAEDPITGFGKQQSMLVLFQEHSVGRVSFDTTEMGSGRVLLSMPYTPINSRVGCDLPGSIQLVENNLVFANSDSGVHLVRDSSSAYENNIVCISQKVNGTPLGDGLLGKAKRAQDICSFDDDQRYWLVLDGEVFAWDYTVSGYSDPSWFFFTDVPGVAFLRAAGVSCHLDGLGRVTIFRRTFLDYGGPIDKLFRFAAQHFDEYNRLKDVLKIVFSVRGDTDTDIHIRYETDYGVREDLTPIQAYSWRLVPRDLSHRYLGVERFAKVAVRRPMCRHVRHFTMTLYNHDPGKDMAVISASLFFRYQRRDR